MHKGTAGTRSTHAPTVPPAGSRSREAGRSTEQLKLRLHPEDALRLRFAARERGVEVSAYVAQLLDDPERFPLTAPPVSDFPLAEVSRLAGMLGALPEEARRSRGELRRAFGLLMHFFEMPETATNAERHAYALAGAAREAHAAIENVDAAVEKMLDELASIREDLALAACRLAGRSSTPRSPRARG